jgi:DNA-binding beta-propeller fold protein YncE
MAFDSGKGEIFVQSLQSISVISDGNNKIVASIPLGTGDTYAMAYDSGNGLILFTDDHGLNAISDSSNSIVALGLAAAGSAPWGVAYDPAMNEVFVANYGPNAASQYTVTVVSDASLATSSTTTSVTPSSTSTSVSPTTSPTQANTLSSSIAPASSSSSKASSSSISDSYLLVVAIQAVVILSLALVAQQRTRRPERI